MNEVIKTILERRTIRKYQEKQLRREELDLILEAGLYAPTSGGMQRVEMLVCQDKEVNDKLGKINRKMFGHANSDGINFVSETQKSIADDDTIKSAFYDAPTVITLFAPTDWLYNQQDCASVAITMSIAAWSLGIGSCYVSRAEETFATEYGHEIMKKAGISENKTAFVHLCLGYPTTTENIAKKRKDSRIKYL